MFDDGAGHPAARSDEDEDEREDVEVKEEIDDGAGQPAAADGDIVEDSAGQPAAVDESAGHPAAERRKRDLMQEAQSIVHQFDHRDFNIFVLPV